MKKMQFSIIIHASKERVWETLWNDKSFREWASIIDPGTYMVGDLQVGNEIQFISESSGYGVTSLVQKLIAGELLLLRHRVDTKDSGKRERKKEWTGGEERYLLTERDGTTTLTISFDVPAELEEELRISYPKALDRVKVLAEKKK